ncbi:hypothetical protein GCM10010497_14980 [Streptomyces cinereoruber]|uniref:M20/M25/M40 family metallo-hydrolase n=2 Tax=Streptomyces cinereoruber TaxID=67260 RepID=A0AAV4KG96_9ACTN|nr:hypothetical protein GCM10010497_14980 [Streptomyces cinereoruber]
MRMTAESTETAALRERVRVLMPRAKEDLTELVAMRSVADPRQFPPEECAKAADFLVRAFTEAGLRDVRRVTTPDGTDAVVGHAPGPEGAPTVLLYCHYDVQPPLDDAAWRTPPFEPTERDGRWYGRGAADCKGNIAMHLTALRALGGPEGRGFPVNLKFVAEGSEEQGTAGLEELVPLQPDLFAADALRALTDHLTSAAPWGARVEVESAGRPFRARTDGPAYRALATAFREAYGKDMVRAGQGGSIPLCGVLATHFPDAEIALIGVEEPGCLIHAPDESVDPSEIERMALTEALFLSCYATPL